jgi:hypothetical protein
MYYRVTWNTIRSHRICLVLTIVISFLGWGETDVSPLGTSATDWPIVPTPDAR